MRSGVNDEMAQIGIGVLARVLNVVETSLVDSESDYREAVWRFREFTGDVIDAAEYHAGDRWALLAVAEHAATNFRLALENFQRATASLEMVNHKLALLTGGLSNGEADPARNTAGDGEETAAATTEDAATVGRVGSG